MLPNTARNFEFLRHKIFLCSSLLAFKGNVKQKQNHFIHITILLG